MLRFAVCSCFVVPMDANLLARELGVPGRSKMGKWELIDAIRAAR